MDDGTPTLEVGFAIDFGDSFGQLRSLDDILGEAAANAVREFKRIEAGAKGLDLSGQTASISAFAATTSAAFNKAEFAAERMTARLNEQAATFGMTRAAAAAWRAEQVGATSAADSLREAEASLNSVRAQAAVQARLEASSVAKLAAEHERLVALVRGSQAAQEADAVAAERMRAATDPLYAATKRLNAEIAESTRLYHQGATAPAEYARQQEVLSGRLRAATEQNEAMAVAGGRNANAMRNLAIQMPDVVQGLLTGQKPFTILIQQGGQLVQVAMMAEGGLRAMAVAAGTLALYMAPLAVVGAAAYGAVKLFQDQVKDSGELTRFRDGLGLTHKEMLQLSDGVDKAGDKIERLAGVTVTAGDVMAGLWKTIQDGAGKSSDWSAFESGAVTAFKKVLDVWNVVAAGITAGINGTFNAVKAVWGNFPAVFGDLFVQGANAAINALNALVKAGTTGLNAFITAVNVTQGLNIGLVKAPEIGLIDNANAGAAAKAAKQIASSYSTAYAEARKSDAAFWKQVGDNARQHAKDRLTAEAQAIKENRTPKVDRHAEQLARDAAAAEAAIAGLYKLAEAYGVSDAAALKAQATMKATEAAIKKQGDVDEFVARELRKQVAQRIADSEGAAAAMRGQAAAQAAVNAAVVAGTLPASAANDELAKRVALLPLQTTLQLAALNGDIKGQIAARKAIDDTTDAIKAQNAAKAEARALSGIDQAEKNIAVMQLEMSLIGSTNRERAVAIAALKAQQEIEATMKGADPATVARFIQLKKDEAAAGVAQTEKQDAYNQSLTATLDLMRQMEDRAGAVGNLLSDAFGQAGSALGDLIKSLASYQTKEAELAAWKDAENKRFAGDAVQLARIEAEAAMRSQTIRIDGIGSTISAAKNLFAEHSAGYEAMAAAEKAFALVQLANTAVNVAAGAAKMFASLGPFGFAAVAAMIGVMASFGFNSGGGSADPKLYADAMQKAQGTGSVLGDSTAKSNSIANSLALVAKNTKAQLEFASAQLSALRSIETNIGALSSTLAKQLGLASGSFDTSKLGLGSSTEVSGIAGIALGRIWSQVPVIGGLINGIAKALFGTTTTKTLVDQGVQFYAGTLAQILQGGIEGANYQLVEIVKKSHFLGITTGTSTSYQTYTSALDSTVKTQTSLLLTSIYSSVVDAAKTLGLTSVESLLASYTVSLGKISLKDLKGSEITDAISAVFSKAGDDMAAYVLPEIAVFQKVGEGLFETLQRVAKDFTTIDVEMQSIGRTFGAVGTSSVAAREDLINLFGSLDEFVSETDFYRQHFLTEAQQIAPVMTAVSAELSRLGLSGVTTIAQFKGVVDGLDLTTEAGRQMYAALMGVAQGFYAVDQYQAALASKRSDLEVQLMQAQDNAAGALAAQRAAELAAMDASLRGLQAQIYLYQDIATARDTLSTAYNTEKDALDATIKKFGDFSASLATFRDTLSGGGSDLTSYTGALAKLMSTGSLAAAGDETALGALQGVSTSFLSIAKDNASSLAQYRRDVALVTGYVNGGIGAADAAVDYAQAQLAALDQSVAGLIDINKSVISVHDAIVALEALIAQASPGLQGYTDTRIPDAPVSASSADDGSSMAQVVSGLKDQVANLQTAIEAMKVDTGKTARVLDRLDTDGIVVRTNVDEPLTVQSA